MRFLADENVPGSLVEGLSDFGHDVVWVRSARPGISDAEIVGWAARESRILLTFDKDFGELVWQTNLPASCGIVLFRLPMPTARDGAKLARRLNERGDWPGHFSVVEPDRIRMRPLV